jgi:hypothetical protein
MTPTPTPSVTPTLTPTPSFTPTPNRISEPDAPRNLVAYGANEQIIMYWSAPSYDGRREIIDHIIEYTPVPSQTSTQTPTNTPTPTETPTATPTIEYTQTSTPTPTPTPTPNIITQLLLHLDGNPNHLIDSSANQYLVNLNYPIGANNYIYTNLSVSGSASHYFGGNNNNGIVVPQFNTSVFNSDFTIEFWTQILYPNVIYAFGFFSALFSGANYAILELSYSLDGHFFLSVEPHRYLLTGIQSGLVDMIFSELTHIAIVRHNNIINVYVNGISITSSGIYLDGGGLVSSINAPLFVTNPCSIFLGVDWIGPSEEAIDGLIDEFRISSIAQYFGPSFTPPSAPLS